MVQLIAIVAGAFIVWAALTMRLALFEQLTLAAMGVLLAFCGVWSLAA